MAPPRLVIGFVAGAALGAACAGLGLFLGSTHGEPPAPTLAASEDGEPAGGPARHWVRPGEALLGPTAVLPTSLGIEDDAVVVGYELADLAPGSPGAGPDLPVAAPERWTLFTTAGDIAGSTSSVRARTARFPLPAGYDGSVTGARIDAWRVRMPLTHDVEVAHSDFAEHVLDEGIGITLRAILEQTNSTLVQFRVRSPIDTFTAPAASFTSSFAAQPQLSGLGPGWTNVGAIESGVQLTFVGGELPDPFRVRVRTHSWVPVSRPVDLSLEALTLE